MFLGISSRTIEEVQHLSFFALKVVCVDLKLPLDLQLLALKGRISSIR